MNETELQAKLAKLLKSLADFNILTEHMVKLEDAKTKLLAENTGFRKQNRKLYERLARLVGEQ